MQKITEEMKVHEAWYDRAREIRTVRELQAFVKELTTAYEHDYGTIVHAMTAAAMGAAWCVNRSPSGGITGFQASGVMWEFVRRWSFAGNKIGMRFVDMDNLLHPQGEEAFDMRHIERAQMDRLQEEAKKMLAEEDKRLTEENAGPPVDPKVRAHWQSIVDGKAPFGFQVFE